jgi:hypothetical protein
MVRTIILAVVVTKTLALETQHLDLVFKHFCKKLSKKAHFCAFFVHYALFIY